jgi:isoleucyl-tRNA synthetase
VVLGNFYLDIIKDRIYTTRVDSVPRRSAQTALYYISESFVRWIAPILSFTADEIWEYLPGDRDESVFLDEWYQAVPALPDSDNKTWNQIIAVRVECSKVLERLRVNGSIGSSLDAEVTIYCSGEKQTALNSVEDELRYVLITSYAGVCSLDDRPEDAIKSEIEGVWIKAVVSGHEKCVRCWHHREDVGSHGKHPDLCLRCVENVDGQGEQRHHA